MDNLVLINKVFGIDEDYVPDDLVICDNNENNCHKYVDPTLKPMIKKEVYKYFLKLREEALKEKLDIIIDSGYRSGAYQKDIWHKHFDREFLKLSKEFPMLNKDQITRMAINNTNNLVARPGHSEHQTGLAFDIACFRNGIYCDEIGDCEEVKWMDNNAHKYGFILRYPKGKESITGFDYEPWHYRFIGESYSSYCHNNNLTLEEYHQKLLKK